MMAHPRAPARTPGAPRPATAAAFRWAGEVLNAWEREEPGPDGPA